MNCGRRALLWSPRLRRKRARFPGANFGRGAALSRPGGCPDAGALASGDQGLVWLPLAWSSAGRRTPRALTGRPWHRGRGCGRGGGKKKGGSQGTRSGKAKRRLPFTPNAFCQTGRPSCWALWDGRRQRAEERDRRGRERQRAQAPTRALAGKPSTARANRSLDRAGPVPTEHR